MTQGRLKGALVPPDFSPKCENCALYDSCKGQEGPRHKAFPHSWHWGREAEEFPEGLLILDSWVGTIAIGEPHTGCTHYRIKDGICLPLQDKHRKYLANQLRITLLEAELDFAEKRGRHPMNKYEEIDRLREDNATLRVKQEGLGSSL